MTGRRIFAFLALVILSITDTAPHRHGDEPFQFANVLSASEIHDTRCSNPNSGIAHLHRDSPRRIEACVACMRQHIQATRSLDVQRTPRLVVQSLSLPPVAATGRAAIRKATSRAPPLLAA